MTTNPRPSRAFNYSLQVEIPSMAFDVSRRNIDNFLEKNLREENKSAVL